MQDSRLYTSIMTFKKLIAFCFTNQYPWNHLSRFHVESGNTTYHPRIEKKSTLKEVLNTFNHRFEGSMNWSRTLTPFAAERRDLRITSAGGGHNILHGK